MEVGVVLGCVSTMGRGASGTVQWDVFDKQVSFIGPSGAFVRSWEVLPEAWASGRWGAAGMGRVAGLTGGGLY